MGSKWALQLDVTMDQTVLQAQHAGDCVWLWCTASPSLFWPRLTLLLCFGPTEWANAASEKLNHRPECKWRGVLLVFSRLQGFLFCDETPLCPYKQSVAIWGGGWFLFQPNVIFSHLPHFLASHRNPPRWNAVGLTWVSGLRRVCILTGSQFRVASTWTALPFAFWILSAVLNYLFLKLKAKLEINHQQKDSNTLTPLDFIRMYECTRVFCRPGGNACMYLENYSNAHKEVSVKLGEAQDQTGACFIPVS